MNKLEKLIELVKDNNLDIDIQYLYNENEEFNELEENVIQYIQESEIIYYSKAMAYLSDNDNSLYESINEAIAAGYTIEKLNSELLATLLYQQNLTNEWYEISEQVEEILND
tara:strand:- start:16 stop:351 length:336 start_codon:yes stop_codon:yes gene_type:complete